MGTFMIPGKAFEGITAIGAPAPEAGFYEASITEVILDPKNAQKRRFRVQLPNGYRTLDFVSLTHDADGNAFQGLDERQVRGRTAGLRSVLESMGYGASDIEGAQAITDEWFLSSANGGRKGYVEFVPGQQGIEGSFSKIVRWMNKAQYDALKSSGATVKSDDTVAATQVSTASVANGAGAPAVQATLPPPPSAAQQIVS